MTELRTLILLFFTVVPSAAVGTQSGKVLTVREALSANGITDVRRYPDYFLNAKIEPGPANRRYVYIGYHITPSAEQLFVFSRAGQLLGELDGWELLTLPDDSVVYQRSQVHFAATHSVGISVFDPATRKDLQIYPPKPNQAIRTAFIERVARVYKERGEAWFREHNHHMNPEGFDSALMGKVTLNATVDSISFLVRYGDPENANDPVRFTQNVEVTCSPIRPVERIRCVERAK